MRHRNTIDSVTEIYNFCYRVSHDEIHQIEFEYTTAYH